MQNTFELDETWNEDKVRENLEKLRSEVLWKKFQISDPIENQKNYSLTFYLKINEREASIILWRKKAQISSITAFDYELCFMFLNKLLMENGKSILLESLVNSIRKDGKLSDRFEKATIDIVMNLYFELVEGKVEEDLVGQTKNLVKESLLFMLEAIEKI